jgi:tRNA C32,U32 (ribose-2'-O)-methylase TrmJ
VSKGAQWILYRTKVFESLTYALSDVDLSVAMTRWLPDQPNCLPNLPSLLQQPGVQQMLRKPLGTLDRSQQQQQDQVRSADMQQQQGQDACPPSGQQQSKPLKVALVFGREEYGLSDEEVAACDLACAISIGRLQVGSLNAALG